MFSDGYHYSFLRHSHCKVEITSKIARKRKRNIMQYFRMQNMKRLSFLAAATIILLLLCAPNAGATINAHYLYTFSDFNGKIPYTWPGLSIDREHGEIYVINQGSVSVFNSVGMEVYRFGDDRALGLITDVAVEKDGTILVLAYRGYSFSILRCNFRGELKSALKLTGLPQEFSELRPNRLVYWNGDIYLADLQARKIVVIDSSGAFIDGYDVGAILKEKEEEKPGTENDLVGFNVDLHGNMLFTVPTMFVAYRLSRDHKAESFGSPGNIDGKFNVVGGIASDDRGFIYVADLLKNTVMVYDNNFKFQMQFGHRSSERGSLYTPLQIEVMNDKLIVNQARKKGVSVFRMQYD
jgi:DNA-binding beta-propeller fold protein YncE